LILFTVWNLNVNFSWSKENWKSQDMFCPEEEKKENCENVAESQFVMFQQAWKVLWKNPELAEREKKLLNPEFAQYSMKKVKSQGKSE